MRFRETQLDDYLIYAGAVEAANHGGYIAALVVSRRGVTARRGFEAFRDESMGCGYCWPSAERAISYAVTRAREMIRKGSPALRC